MTLLRLFKPLCLAVTAAVFLSGCVQMGGGPEDEEKDPHYLSGMNRLSSLDYDGAIAAFESALAANPKSAAAHLELGLLYDERKTNYAAAIYHLEKHLELRPQSNMAETARAKILACKLELAKTVSFALVSRQVQDEIRRLSNVNSQLMDQVKQLKAELLEQAATFSNKLALAAQISTAAQTRPSITFEPEHRPAPSERLSPVDSSQTVRQPSATPRTYVVKSGDTLATIARRMNVRLSALQAANPRVDARKLKAGQTLNLPSGRD